MDPHLADRGLRERGVTSVQFLLAGALSLVLFLVFANLIVVQYGRGAIRSALDQGARVGCCHRGPRGMRASESKRFSAKFWGATWANRRKSSAPSMGDLVVAHGSAVFPSWTPFTSDFVVDLSAQATLEPNRA